MSKVIVLVALALILSVNANLLELNKEGVTQYNEGNKKKAISIWLKACEKDGIPSCINLGHVYRLEKQDTLAQVYYKKACIKGYMLGCSQLKASTKNKPSSLDSSSSWKKAGFSVKDSTYYIKAKASISEAKKWKRAGFRAKDAHYYLSIGKSLDQALKRVK